MSLCRDSFRLNLLVAVLALFFTGCSQKISCANIYFKYEAQGRLARDINCDPLEAPANFAKCMASREPTLGEASFFVHHGIDLSAYLLRLAAENKNPDAAVVKSYGTLLLSESLIGKDERIAEFLLKSGVNPFEGHGHIPAVADQIIRSADRESWQLILKYYPEDKHPQSAEISAYLEQCECGKPNVDEIACWDE